MDPGSARACGRQGRTTRKWPSGAGGDKLAAMNIALRKVLTMSDYLAWAAAEGDGAAYRADQRADRPNVAGTALLITASKAACSLRCPHAVAAAGIHGEVFTDGLTVPIDPHTGYEPDADGPDRRTAARQRQ